MRLNIKKWITAHFIASLAIFFYNFQRTIGMFSFLAGRRCVFDGAHVARLPSAAAVQGTWCGSSRSLPLRHQRLSLGKKTSENILPPMQTFQETFVSWDFKRKVWKVEKARSRDRKTLDSMDSIYCDARIPQHAGREMPHWFSNDLWISRSFDHVLFCADLTKNT